MQRSIAEELSKEPEAEEAEASKHASADRSASLQATLQRRILEPLGHAWHAVAAWLAKAWAAFINWTVMLGHNVKQLFFSKKS
jgi:hypothetical protein